MPATRDALIIAVLFLLPGFVADTIYGRGLNRPKREITEYVFALLLWSAINYVVFAWLVVLFINQAGPGGYAAYLTRNAAWVAILAPLVLLAAPTITALLVRSLVASPPVARILAYVFLAPAQAIPKAWDWVFTREEDYLAFVVLNDGTRFAAGWGRASFASSFPNEEDVYFEVLYSVLEDDRFGDPIPLSRGILLRRDEIRSIELYTAEGSKDVGQAN